MPQKTSRAGPPSGGRTPNAKRSGPSPGTWVWLFRTNRAATGSPRQSAPAATRSASMARSPSPIRSDRASASRVRTICPSRVALRAAREPSGSAGVSRGIDDSSPRSNVVHPASSASRAPAARSVRSTPEGSTPSSRTVNGYDEVTASGRVRLERDRCRRASARPRASPGRRRRARGPRPPTRARRPGARETPGAARCRPSRSRSRRAPCREACPGPPRSGSAPGSSPPHPTSAGRDHERQSDSPGLTYERRGWDSNPRKDQGPHRFSRPARSTAPAPLQGRRRLVIR